MLSTESGLNNEHFSRLFAVCAFERRVPVGELGFFEVHEIGRGVFVFV